MIGFVEGLLLFFLVYLASPWQLVSTCHVSGFVPEARKLQFGFHTKQSVTTDMTVPWWCDPTQHK
jgi:hypothetical protein